MSNLPKPSLQTTFTQNLSNSKKLDDRESDLKKLSEIIDVIDNVSDEIELVNQIGNIVKKINFNDNDGQYIRNKYGSIDRSNNAEFRSDALEFTYLEVLSNMGDSERTNIAALVESGEFIRLREKISFIISAEKDFSINDDDALNKIKEVGTLVNLKKCVGNFHIGKICHKLLEIFGDENMSSLDFSNRQDRYYFGNILLKVGELSKELIDFMEDDEVSGVFKVFKKIRNYRIAHFPALMVNGSDVEINSSEFIRDRLFPIAYHRTEEIRNHLRSLEKPIFKDSHATKISKLLFSDKFQEIDEIMLDSLSVLDTRMSSNDQKMVQKKNPKDPKRVRNLDVDHLPNLLNGISNQLQFLKEGKGLSRAIKKINDQISQYNVAIKMDNNELEILDGTFNKDNFDKLRNNVNKRRESLLNHSQKVDNEIGKDEKTEIETKLPQDNFQEFNGDNVELLREEVLKLLDTLAKEVIYLKEIQADENIPKEKKIHILQFSLVKIVDIFKNIKKEHITKFTPIISHSVIFHRSISKSTNIRNKGIAHDIFSLDNDELFKIIDNHTVTLEEDLKALSAIVDSDQYVKKYVKGDKLLMNVALNNIAFYYLRLGDNKQAEEMLIKALKYYESDTISIIQERLSASGIELEFDQLSEYDGDVDRLQFLEYEGGNSRLQLICEYFNALINDLKLDQYKTLRNLFVIYTDEKDWNNAHKTIRSIMEVEDILGGFNSGISMSEYAFCLWKLDRIEESKKEFQCAFDTAIDVSSKVNILLKKISLFTDVKEDKLCNHRVKDLESMLHEGKITNPVEVILTYLQLGFHYIDNNRKKYYMEKAVNFLEENVGILTKIMGNRLLYIEAEVLALEIDVLVGGLSFYPFKKDKTFDTLDNAEIHKMEKLFEKWKKFNKLEDNSLYKNSIHISSIKDLASCFTEASHILYQNKPNFIQNPDKAFEYSNNAIELEESCNISSSITLYDRGSMYLELASNNQNLEEYLKKAQEYLKKTLKKDNGVIDDELRGLIHQKLAITNEKLGYNKEAIDNLRMARHICDEINTSDDSQKERLNKNSIHIEKSLDRIIRKEVLQRRSSMESITSKPPCQFNR